MVKKSLNNASYTSVNTSSARKKILEHIQHYTYSVMILHFAQYHRNAKSCHSKIKKVTKSIKLSKEITSKVPNPDYLFNQRTFWSDKSLRLEFWRVHPVLAWFQELSDKWLKRRTSFYQLLCRFHLPVMFFPLLFCKISCFWLFEKYELHLIFANGSEAMKMWDGRPSDCSKIIEKEQTHKSNS